MNLEILYRATHTPTNERAPNCADFRKTIHKVFSEYWGSSMTLKLCHQCDGMFQ